MPSEWNVGHRAVIAERREIDLAGRNFGRKLAIQLDAVAPSLQNLVPGEELSRQVDLLCDLSDWCAATTGYGNMFLAQRSLDLASVGLARLITSLDFPLVKCEKLAERMTPAWMDVSTRARTLNDEAGTNLFVGGGTQEEMEKTWGAGRDLMRQNRDAISCPKGQGSGLGLIETAVLKANSDFFEDDAVTKVVPLTLVRSWDSKRYERIINGLELQNVNKALALLKFRSVVGRFPERPEFTNEQLREHDHSVAEAKKYGLKVSRMDESLPPGEVAFMQAWEDRKDKNPKEHNLNATAWRAYSEIKTGQFMDQDTREERMAAQMRGGIGVKSPRAP